MPVQKPTPATDNQWARAFIDGGRGPRVEKSTVNSESHLDNCHQWSDVPFLEASSWHSGSLCQDCSLVVTQSTSPRPGGFSIYKTAQRLWLTVLPIAFEEVLDSA